jgi:DNA-binding transcriptional ArsR family regulator
MTEIDQVFKALADPSRRKLLDLLHDRNGQTLSELCSELDMARQSVTQHLGLLEDANLISVQRQGREKLHYFNPVPIHDIYERWIRKFETERLTALHNLKATLEGNDHEQ